MSKFIKYCGAGLDCNGHGQIGKLIKVAAYENKNGSIKLQPESARNMANAGRSVTINKEEYEARPTDAYDDTAEAIWALELCGWTPMALDH